MKHCSQKFHFRFANSGEIRDIARQKFAQSNNILNFGIKNQNQKNSINDIADKVAKARSGFKQSNSEDSVHFSNSEISNFENEKFNVINGGFSNKSNENQLQNNKEEIDHEEINEDYFEEYDEDEMEDEDDVFEIIDEYLDGINSMKSARESIDSIISWHENALKVSDFFCQKIESESRFLMKKKEIFNAKKFVSEVESEINNLEIDKDIEFVKSKYEELFEFTQNQEESSTHEVENLKSDLEMELEIVDSGIEKCRELQHLLSEMIFEIKNLCNESLVNMEKYKESMSRILKFEKINNNVENQEIKNLIEKRQSCCC